MIEVRKPVAIYAITKHGIASAKKLVAAMPDADLFVSEKLMALAPEGAKPLPLPMGPLLADTFTAYDCHVHIISVGAVVRMIAPLLRNKKVDPAIVCVDDAARFAICVLSGHVGRGNAFTDRVAGILGAQSVITTASDAIGTLTVDILGRDLGWTLDDMDRNVTRGCAAVVNATNVLFVQETGEPNFWPLASALPPGVTYARSLEGVDPAAYEILLIASDRDIENLHPRHFDNAVIYRPKSLVVGIGCDRGAPLDMIERGLAHVLASHGLSPKSIREIATIDKKADEVALLELCAKNKLPLRTFTAEALDAAPMVTPSETVLRHVGTRGVSEPAALLASGASSLLVTKQVYTEPGVGRSMTVAVARVPFEVRSEASREVSHG